MPIVQSTNIKVVILQGVQFGKIAFFIICCASLEKKESQGLVVFQQFDTNAEKRKEFKH